MANGDVANGDGLLKFPNQSKTSYTENTEDHRVLGGPSGWFGVSGRAWFFDKITCPLSLTPLRFASTTRANCTPSSFQPFQRLILAKHQQGQVIKTPEPIKNQLHKKHFSSEIPKNHRREEFWMFKPKFRTAVKRSTDIPVRVRQSGKLHPGQECPCSFTLSARAIQPQCSGRLIQRLCRRLGAASTGAWVRARQS